MPDRPRHPDLVALAAGQLSPADRERVEARVRADPELERRYREIVDHLARYDRLPAAPPPPFATIAASLDVPARRAAIRPRARDRAPRRAAWALGGAAVVVVIALAATRLYDGGPRPDAEPVGVAYEGVRVHRGGTIEEGASVALRVGDLLRADRPAEARLDGRRVRAILDGGAALRWDGEGRVTLHEGRAFFAVAPPGAFAVRTPHGEVRVLGTVFEVHVAEADLEVRVDAGRVSVAGTTLGPGEGWRRGETFAYAGEVGAWFRRPRLSLGGPSTAAAGETVTLLLRLENPTHVAQELSSAAGPQAALWVELVTPSGGVHDLPVRAGTWRGAATGPAGTIRLGRGGSASRRLALPASLTAQTGAYRCRAMYRPQDQPPLVSDEIRIEVR